LGISCAALKVDVLNVDVPFLPSFLPASSIARCHSQALLHQFCRHAVAATLAVNSMPNAFMTASVVFKVGLPFSLNER
jgi:hypothetical protein